jgi:hypothetical protein
MVNRVLKKAFLVFLICAVSFCFAGEPAAVGYISFEDNFGGAAYIDDQSGVAGDILCLSGGQVGKYGDFENPTETDTGDSLAVYHPGDNGTIAMWLNIDEDISHYPVIWDASAAGNQWKTYPAGTNLYSRISSSWQPAIASFTASSWFHYTFTWSRNGETVSTYVYIDGVEAASIEQDWYDASPYLNVGGAFSWYPKYNGSMDEVYVFDEALDPNQISIFVDNSTNETIATNPRPFVGSDVNSTATDLQWTAPAGVSSAVYDVYFGTDANLVSSDLIADDITDVNCSSPAGLKNNTKYYWRVDVNDAGTIYEGVVWTFEVEYLGDVPVAVAHCSFEDNFGGADYLDDSEGAVGSIDFISAGIVGKAGEFTNPEGAEAVGGDSLSFDAQLSDKGTIAMYMNIDPFTANPTVWDGSADANWWKTYLGGDNIYNRIDGINWTPILYDINSAVGMGNWFHYTFTWNREATSPTAETKLYIDGALAATGAEALGNFGSVCLGGGNISWYQKFNGKFDEFYQFDRALNASQVSALKANSDAGNLAYDPKPFVGNATISSAQQLKWKAPEGITSPSYNVYFSTDVTQLESNQIAAGITGTSVDIDVSAEQTYYWRVDVVDGGTVYDGIVWSFNTNGYLDSDLNTDGYVNLEDLSKVAGTWKSDNFTTGSDLVIDDFESYNALPSSPNVLDTWEVVPDNYYAVPVWGDTTLDVTSSAHSGSQALSYSYDFTTVLDEYAISEFMYVFDTPQDLSSYGSFEMWINCHSGNSREQYFYVKLFQGGIGCGGVTGEYRLYPSLYQVGSTEGATTDQAPGWIKVTGELGQYEDLTDIHGLEIGCSTEPYGDDMGSGTIDIDDIKFVFAPECTGSPEGDINGDCSTDILDVKELALEWLK